MLESLLNIDFFLLPQGYEVGLDWLGQFARIIIEGVGSIGLGIILFTLVLKAITLPFDIYQRISMRKQNLTMRTMKDDLDKLQKQYANDQKMYNAKMSELYKKNGFNMFGSCLPMILSLAILIVAFQGFRTYSQYANLEIFVDMSEAYNEAVLENGFDGVDYTLEKENGEPKLTDGKYTLCWEEDGEQKTQPLAWEDGKNLDVPGAITYTMSEMNGSKYLVVTQEGKFLYYYYNLETETVQREYQLDKDALTPLLTEEEKASLEGDKTEEEIAAVYRSHVIRIGAVKAAEVFRANKPSFLWVRNVWYPDVSYNHPVPTYNDFKTQLNVSVTLEDGSRKRVADVMTSTLYDNLTSELADEKSAPNGYFILIVLSIGFMLLSQFISMRSQKDTEKYQSADGSAAGTQKMMMFVMPIIFGVFAFMYSAAFSIYMVMSSVVSLAVTLLANFFIDRVFKKKEEKEVAARYGYTPAWMQKQKKNDKRK